MIEIIRHRHFLPTFVAVLYVGIAIRYVFSRDYGRACYWLSACAINVSATWGMGK